MKKWEYKTLILEYDDVTDDLEHVFNFKSLENQMNTLGLEGWEIATTENYNENGYTCKYVIFLKKELI